MITEDQLYEAFDKGCEQGLDSLTEEEKEAYTVQEFILEWENGGLTGYLYNTLPEKKKIESLIEVSNNLGLSDLSKLLSEAFELFISYQDPLTPSTWGDELKKYDPNDKLTDIDERIRALNYYGIPE